MKLVCQYQTAEAASEGTKADVLAMIDYLKASVEGHTFQGWASAYYLCHVGDLVDQAHRC